MRNLVLLISSLVFSMAARAVVDPATCNLAVTQPQIAAICDSATQSKMVSYLFTISNQEQTGGASDSPARIAAAKAIYFGDSCGSRILNTILIDDDHSYDEAKAAEGKSLTSRLSAQIVRICSSPQAAGTPISVDLNIESSIEVGGLLRKASLAGDRSVQFVGGPQVTTYSTGNLVCYFQNSDDSVSCSVSK